MFKHILEELKHHAPFTLFGALAGIVVVFFLKDLPDAASYKIFYTLHPLHVVLSAFVTASMYELHKRGKIKAKYSLWALLAVGYAGSVGIATLSDSLIPYVGESLLNLPNKEVHAGFIEEWWLVNSFAVLGIAAAYFRPATKVSHSAHIMVSTGASLFHMIMAAGQSLNWYYYTAIFIFLFLSVWIPCCVSDIVFPLLFIKGKPDEEAEDRRNL